MKVKVTSSACNIFAITRPLHLILKDSHTYSLKACKVSIEHLFTLKHNEKHGTLDKLDYEEESHLCFVNMQLLVELDRYCINWCGLFN